MAEHNQTGKTGEALACQYLLQKGYTLLETNYKYNKYEVDIIASKENTLHFIEVKTKSGNSLGTPERRVNRPKITRMKWVAEYYLSLHTHWKFIQFDIMSVEMKFGEEVQYFLLEDIY